MTEVASPAQETALDHLLPSYDASSLVSHGSPADCARVAAAIRLTTLRDARVALVLEAVRRLGRLPVRTATFASPEVFESGAVTLVDDADELVHAFCGQPWPGGRGVDPSTPESVLLPGDQTAVRAVLSIRCAATPYGTLLVSETRVACGGEARDPFLSYWDVVQFGSALVRRSMLAAIARSAELHRGGARPRTMTS